MGNLKTCGLVAVAAAVCVLLPTTAGGAPASPARAADNTATFQDSTGEGIPDIQTVVVSNTNDRMISFQINLASLASPVTPDLLVGIDVDSDNSALTGGQGESGAPGVDYAIELFQSQINLFKWDGTNYTRRPDANDPPQTTLIFSSAPNTLTIKINASELGNTTKFNFDVVVVAGIVFDPVTGDADFSRATFDSAPDLGHGLWSFEVKLSPTRLVVKSFSTTPAKPVAGKPFTVRMSAIRDDTNAVLSGGQVVCVAIVGGKRLNPHTGKFVRKQAVCVFRIPANAKGKRIRGSISIVFEGKKATKGFVFTIG